MGLIVFNYNTDQGFLVPDLYIKLSSIRMLKTSGGSDYGMVYTSLAYKSLSDFQAGTSPLSIPHYLANVEDYLTANDFYKQTIFGFAYEAIKRAWQSAGYTVVDYYPQPPTPKTYTYDTSGYNVEGYNAEGYNRQGYDRDGYDRNGLDINGNPKPTQE